MCDLDTLYRENEPILRTFIANRVPNRSDRDDVLQDVAYKITKGFEDFDKQNFRGWIRAIARNVIVDYYKKSSRLPDLLASHDTLGISSDDLLATVLDSERRQLVKGCIEHLQEKPRKVIELRWQGERNNDIARTLQITPGHASNLYAAAMTQLINCASTRGI
jgi:RNA polymerase sigma factor (sigma-70 family)